MGELVSVLVPAFNAEKWIGQCIKSVLSQTWPNRELIIVDDGSSDRTFEIARQFQSGWVKVVSQDNMGASAARNKALSLAQGEFIQWLDADDLLARDKISEQLRYAKDVKNSSLLLSASFGSFFYRVHKARFRATGLWADMSPVEWFITRFNDRVWMNPAVWLVSRSLTERIGPWDERLTLNDDGEYFARAVAACEGIKFVPEAICYYRQANADSLSKTYSHQALESLFLSLKLCYGYLILREDSERTRTSALGHLQNCLIFFYPEEKEILARANELAKDLGGTLTAPVLSRKYLLIKKLFGWNIAKRLILTVPKLKKRVLGSCDKLISVLEDGRTP